MARRKHRLRNLSVILGLCGALYVGWSAVRPSNSREWKRDHSRLPVVRFEGSLAHISDVRCFEATAESTEVPRWEDRTYDLDGVRSLWFVLAVFDETGWRGPAHSLLSFGFDDGRFLAISVEARKEVGESYSTWKGLLKRYEVIYVIGDERDLIRTRAVYRPDEVYVYPVRAEPGKIRELLGDMLQAAQALHREPQFYNTLTNNCTTKLRDHVNRIAPGRIPASWKILLPGYADELLRGLDLIDADEPIEAIRARYAVNERARAYRDDPDFSLGIRGGTPGTAPGDRRP